jgi:hypothetical protein
LPAKLPKDEGLEMMLKALLFGAQVLVFTLAVLDLIMTYAVTNTMCPP